MKRWIACLLLILTCSVAHAQQPGGNWEENYRRWQNLSPERKAELKQRFEQLKAMTPEQRQAFVARLEWFRNLPEMEREQMREKFQFFRGLPPEQQQVIRNFVGRWQRAPRFEREMIKRRIHKLRSMPPGQREKILSESRLWMRLNDQQRRGLRQFLFSEHSPFDRRPPDGIGPPGRHQGP